MALVGRIIGWILLISTLPVLATDTLLWSDSGRWAPLSAGDFWYLLSPSSVYTARTAVDVYLTPYVWDPMIASFLTLPASIVLIGLGLLLMLAFAERREALPGLERGVTAVAGRMAGLVLVIIVLPLSLLLMVGRKLGWILLVGAVTALATDAILWAGSGGWAPVTVGKLWFILAPSTIETARGLIQTYLGANMWDSVVLTVLRLPMFLVLMGLALPFILADLYAKWRVAIGSGYADERHIRMAGFAG